MVGLDDLKDVFQSKQFCGSMTTWLLQDHGFYTSLVWYLGFNTCQLVEGSAFPPLTQKSYMVTNSEFSHWWSVSVHVQNKIRPRSAGVGKKTSAHQKKELLDADNLILNSNHSDVSLTTANLSSAGLVHSDSLIKPFFGTWHPNVFQSLCQENLFTSVPFIPSQFPLLSGCLPTLTVTLKQWVC